ncbi:hypothetical protein NQ314_001807 [Rhamnusium bicolor]|uniref:Peptidase aspartic putative domain-containing protein n=1 Tax=Rhamnusium bicolor TaxID=1586634 RepID=A0AAV8ZQZ2_9CUCU|nr:hypothetical protein NQ314_001807 [Rhamnusium bicolor]
MNGNNDASRRPRRHYHMFEQRKALSEIQRSVKENKRSRHNVPYVIQEYVQTHVDISFKDDLEIRQEVFTDNYKKYLELQDKIEEKEKTEEADRITVENIYFSTLSLIKSVCRNNNPELNSSNISNHTIDTKSIKLPHVKIPTFSGQVEEWNSFVDLFTSLIHNNDSLTDVQRFYYLKGFLKDEPLNLVNNLRLISENYKVAWDILKKRYDNEFIIINAHIIAILDAPIITKGNACNLREFVTNIRQHLNSLHALKLPVDKWDVILVCILTKKLDYQTHKAYELEKSKTDLPTINEFLNIVERHCIALEIVSAPASNHNQFKSKQQRSFINSNSTPSNKFAGEVNAQSNQVAKHAMPNTYQGDDQSPPLAAGNATALLTQNNNRSQILLATAQVNVVASNGNLIPARALLDSGSQTSFITTKIFKRLNLRAYHQNIQILGLSSSQVNVNKMVDITIQSRITNYNAKFSCAILENITFDLPHYSVNRYKYKIPFQLTLADPEYHTPAPIDLLIGADLFFELLLADTKVLGVNLTILQNTKLGYIVSGQAPSTFVHHVASTFCSTLTNDVDENISKFWQLEEVSSKQMLSPQERLCEKSFIRNTILSNGQYTVHLPFVNDTARLLLGGSFNTALRRFYSLERRLMKDSQLYTEYKKFINESITLLTVTYGTSAAPFLATRCLIKLANDEIANYPVASAALLSDTEIQELTYNCHWLHVKTKENPSDLLSRGTDPTALRNATIWWKGPEWLYNYNTKFIQNATFDLDYLVPEQRKIASHLSREIDQDFSRFSNFSRLQRAVAYCFRFAHNAHPKNTKLSGSLTAEELNQAHDAVIRIVQRQVLLKEYNTPPLQWPLARVIRVLPGRDGRVRVVEIKTQSGIYTRPITKLCVLPLD